MNLTEARAALAAAVSTLDGVTCTARPVPGNTRVRDAWVTAGRRSIGPFFGTHLVELSAFVVVGSDETKADSLVDELSGPLLSCLDDLYAQEASVEPQVVVTTGAVPGNLYTLALTATFELSE